MEGHLHTEGAQGGRQNESSLPPLGTLLELCKIHSRSPGNLPGRPGHWVSVGLASCPSWVQSSGTCLTLCLGRDTDTSSIALPVSPEKGTVQWDEIVGNSLQFTIMEPPSSLPGKKHMHMSDGKMVTGCNLEANHL